MRLLCFIFLNCIGKICHGQHGENECLNSAYKDTECKPAYRWEWHPDWHQSQQNDDEADYLKNNLQGALPAVSLMNAVALNSAFANDQAPDLAMAQQVLGLGNPEDILIGISTSGNSANVVYAVQMAKVKGMKTIGLLGGKECKLKPLVDIAISAPSPVTYKIQEYHLPIYHMLCIAVENEFFDI